MTNQQTSTCCENENREEEPLGAGIFLTPKQIARLDIDPEVTGVIEYHIENENLQILSNKE